MRTGLAVWAGSLSWLVLLAPLQAATVRFHTDGCPDQDLAGLERLAELEFRHRGGPAGTRNFSAILTCQGASAMLILAETATQTVRMRELDLEAHALEARVRLIVLAASELASELSETLGQQSAPPLGEGAEPYGGGEARGAPESMREKGPGVSTQGGLGAGEEAGGSARVSTTVLAPAAGEAELERAASLPFAPLQAPLDLNSSRFVSAQPQPSSELLTAHAVASTRFILGTRGRLLGGGARVTGSFPRVLAWSADILVERGTLEGRTGAFDVRTATLGGVVGFHALWAGLEVTAGSGLRLGLTRTHRVENGESVTASTLAPWGWPMAAAALAYETLPSWVVSLSAESGYTLLPVNRGAGTSLPALRGVWMSAQLGVGYRP